MKPLISVVTVCFNAVKDIEKTILSVINQTYENIEYIIIDGGSTDGTVDVIKKYADRITYWISEPDKGIYDAMNKGIKVATGEWINFMNAGDCFVKETVLEDCFGRTVYNHDERVLYGNCIYKYKWGYRRVVPEDIRNIVNRMTMCHQSVFIRGYKDVYFDLEYKLAADYNQILCLYMDNQRFRYINCYVALEEMQRGSTCNNYKESKEETRKIQISLGLSPLKCNYNYCLSILHFNVSNCIKRILPNTFLMLLYRSGKTLNS